MMIQSICLVVLMLWDVINFTHFTVNDSLL